MSSLSKYHTLFRLSLSKVFVYRANLLFNALDLLIWFGALLLLYRSIGGGLGAYSQPELVTYILGTSFFTLLLFTNVPDQIANEIVEGDIVNYLLRPLAYFPSWIARSIAARLPLFVLGVVELTVLALFFSEDVLVRLDAQSLFQFLTLFFGSLVLMSVFDFIAGIFSFWTDRNFGPRWLFFISARFLSGAAIPIALMPAWAQTIFHVTPFPSLIAAPMEAYLGHLPLSVFYQTVVTQWMWIAVSLVILRLLWKRGVKSYAAYGN